MMKKLGMIAFVMLLMVALALPAFAISIEGAKGERLTVGGEVDWDIGFYNTDQWTNTVAFPSGVNNTGGGTVFPWKPGPSKTMLIDAVPYWTNLWFKVDAGPASMFARFYTFGDNSQNPHSTNTPGVQSGGYGPTLYTQEQYFAGIDVWYGSYKFGNCVLSAGKMEGSTITLAMSQRLGYEPMVLQAGHVAGLGFGCVYDLKAPQVRFEQHISKMFGYQISLVEPGAYDAFGTPAYVAGAYVAQPTYGRNSYYTLPMLAVKLELNFGPVMLFPAGAIQQVQWDGLPAGWDTSMTSWLVRLPVLVHVGPFTGMLEGTYGQNLGGSTGYDVNMCQGEAEFALFTRNALGKIQNANTTAFWADLSWTFGMVTPHIFGGIDISTTPTGAYTTGETSNTRTIYGINCYIKINKNFTIIPELFASDLGYAPGFPIAAAYPYPLNSKLELGQDVVGGIEFQFSF